MPAYLSAGPSAIILGRWSRIHNLFARCVEIAESKSRGSYRPSLFRADDYRATGSNVDAFSDYFDRAHEVQASGANRIATLPAADAGFGGEVAATVSFKRYDSNRPAADWGFLSDGGGGEFFHVAMTASTAAGSERLHSTYDLFNDESEAGSAAGFIGNFGETDRGVTHSIAAGGTIASTIETLGFTDTDVPTVIGGSFDTSLSPEFDTRVKSTYVGNGFATGTPLGTPSHSLRMFANAGTATFYLDGKWAESWYIPGVLTSDERRVFLDYFGEKYRIYSPVIVNPIDDILGLFSGQPVFTADYYAVDGVSGKVAAFIDHNNPAHLFEQAVSGEQVAVPAAHADFGGKTCATFAGGQRYTSNLAIGSWKFTHDGSGCSTYSLFTPTNLASGNTPVYGNYDGNPAIGPAVVCYLNTTTLLFRCAEPPSTNTYLRQIGSRVNDVTLSCVSIFSLTRTPDVYTDCSNNATPNTQTVASASSADSARAMGLGWDGISASRAEMRWWCLMFGPEHSDADRDTIQAWIQDQTGVAP